MNRAARAIIFLLILCFASCDDNPTAPKIDLFKWTVATPESQGMRSEILDSAAVQAAQKGFVDGFLVIRNGYIVAEHYYNGYNEFLAHNVMSVSKSFLSAMAGMPWIKAISIVLSKRCWIIFPNTSTLTSTPENTTLPSDTC